MAACYNLRPKVLLAFAEAIKLSKVDLRLAKDAKDSPIDWMVSKLSFFALVDLFPIS